MIALGFAAALLGMLAYGAASVFQAYAAFRESGARALRHPAYLIGLGCDGPAWLVSLAAFAVLSLFAVQSILAASLEVTIVLARIFLGVSISRRDVIGIGVVVAGLVLASLSAGPEAPTPPSAALQWWLLASAAAVAVIGAAVWRRGGMILQGVVAGPGFGGTALCACAATAAIHAPLDALLSPAAWGVLLSGAVGAVLYARALEHRRIGPPTAAMWGVEVVVPGICGVVLLGDAVRAGWEAAAVVGVVAAIIGCVVLALSPASETVGGAHAEG